MRKLLFLVLIFIAGFLFVGAPNAYAQVNRLNANPDVPQNLHTYSQGILIEIASALSCQLSGVDPTNPAGKCLGIDPVTKKLGYVEGNGGAIGLAGNFISYTFYLPVNTHDYVSNVASNFGITKKAHAQEGIGFTGLQPTLKLWQAFRNITYMIFVVLFVVVGLGIMFRIKIDPRTVMNLQNQIPKIIIAIVLVTFSYAIAGFLIDLMYVVLYLLISIFAQQGLETVNIGAADPFAAAGGIGGISGIASNVAHVVGGVIASIFDGTLGKILASIIGALIGKLIGGVVPGGPWTTGIGTALGAIGGFVLGNKIIGVTAGVIAYLVIVIALFSALLRLWFVLIKCYISVLIAVVMGPFYIAYGLLPGKSGFGQWIKTLVANLSVFPVTIAMLLLGKAFIDGFTHGNAGNPPFIPPLIGDWASPDKFGAIIGLGIILMLPEVANMAKDTLKAPDLKYQSAIGKGLQAGAAVVNAPISTIGSKAWGVDPYTKKPKPLTMWAHNRLGKSANFLGKAGRFILGTESYYQKTNRTQPKNSTSTPQSRFNPMRVFGRRGGNNSGNQNGNGGNPSGGTPNPTGGSPTPTRGGPTSGNANPTTGTNTGTTPAENSGGNNQGSPPPGIDPSLGGNNTPSVVDAGSNTQDQSPEVELVRLRQDVQRLREERDRAERFDPDLENEIRELEKKINDLTQTS